jgi:hypothetical protein
VLGIPVPATVMPTTMLLRLVVLPLRLLTVVLPLVVLPARLKVNDTAVASVFDGLAKSVICVALTTVATVVPEAMTPDVELETAIPATILLVVVPVAKVMVTLLVDVVAVAV